MGCACAAEPGGWEARNIVVDGGMVKCRGFDGPQKRLERADLSRQRFFLFYRTLSKFEDMYCSLTVN